MLDALMAAAPSLADQREQVVRMSAALAVGGPLADRIWRASVDATRRLSILIC
ncbi:hypothetical protein [Mesorhizobium helmanticense]|uniref:hypothetical protein n=1 Tax=Mesorhizobium helmanticense TaxID=1776423 RepID=UPI001FE1C745|nr:hypothetical protein [Mesorhizobium helmanticense]